MQKLRIMTK